MPAERDAVGIPEPILYTASLALAVLVLPSKRSSVIFAGASAPLFLCQYELLKLLGSTHVGSPPETVSTCPLVPIPLFASVVVPDA